MVDFFVLILISAVCFLFEGFFYGALQVLALILEAIITTALVEIKSVCIGVEDYSELRMPQRWRR